MPPGGEKRTQHLTNEEKRGQSEQKKPRSSYGVRRKTRRVKDLRSCRRNV